MASVLQANRPVARGESFVEQRIREARARVRLLDMFVAGLTVFCGSMLYLLAWLLVDRYVETPAGTGSAVLAGWAVLTAGYLYWSLFRPSRRSINPYYAARQVELTIPDAKNSVVNYVDLQDDETVPESIKSAVASRAARDLKQVDINRAIERKQLIWLAAGAGLAFAAALVVSFLPPTRTQVTIEQPKGGNVTVFSGQDLRIQVRLDGRIPPAGGADAARLRIWYNPDDPANFEERQLEPTPEDRRAWGLTIPARQMRSGFDYQVLAGTGETPRFTVTYKIIPEFYGYDIRYEYPAYTKRAPETSENPNLVANFGTQVTFTAHTNRDVASGFIQVEGQQKTFDGKPVEGKPQSIRFQFPMERDGSYRIWFTTVEGDKNADPPTFHMTLLDPKPVFHRFDVHYDYPAYLRFKPATIRGIPNPEIEAKRGTKVTLTAHATRPVKEASLRIDGQAEPIAGERLAGSPATVVFKLPVLDKQTGASVSFTPTTAEKPSEPKRIPIRVLTDQRPTVQITGTDPKPGAHAGAGEEALLQGKADEIQLPADGTLKIEGLATDDHGVAKVTLRMEVTEPAGSRQFLVPKPYRGGKSLMRESDKSYPTRVEYQDVLEPAKLRAEKGQPFAAREGTLIEFWLEAEDNCTVPPGPNHGISERKRLRIVAPERDRQKQQEQQKRDQQVKQEQQKHEQRQDQKNQQENREPNQPPPPGADQQPKDQPQDQQPQDQKQKDGQPQDQQPKDGQGKDGESKDQPAKDGQQKEGKPKGGQSKDGQSKDDQPDEAQPKDGQGKEGQPKEGERKDGKSDDGRPMAGERKEQQPKGGDRKNERSKGAQGKQDGARPDEPQPNEGDNQSDRKEGGKQDQPKTPQKGAQGKQGDGSNADSKQDQAGGKSQPQEGSEPKPDPKDEEARKQAEDVQRALDKQDPNRQGKGEPKEGEQPSKGEDDGQGRKEQGKKDQQRAKDKPEPKGGEGKEKTSAEQPERKGDNPDGKKEQEPGKGKGDNTAKKQGGEEPKGPDQAMPKKEEGDAQQQRKGAANPKPERKQEQSGNNTATDEPKGDKPNPDETGTGKPKGSEEPGKTKPMSDNQEGKSDKPERGTPKKAANPAAPDGSKGDQGPDQPKGKGDRSQAGKGGEKADPNLKPKEGRGEGGQKLDPEAIKKLAEDLKNNDPKTSGDAKQKLNELAADPKAREDARKKLENLLKDANEQEKKDLADALKQLGDAAKKHDKEGAPKDGPKEGNAQGSEESPMPRQKGETAKSSDEPKDQGTATSKPGKGKPGDKKDGDTAKRPDGKGDNQSETQPGGKKQDDMAQGQPKQGKGKEPREGAGGKGGQQNGESKKSDRKDVAKEPKEGEAKGPEEVKPREVNAKKPSDKAGDDGQTVVGGARKGLGKGAEYGTPDAADLKNKGRAAELQLERFKKEQDKIRKAMNWDDEQVKQFLRSQEQAVKRQQQRIAEQEKKAAQNLRSGKSSLNAAEKVEVAPSVKGDALQGGRYTPPPAFGDSYKLFTEELNEVRKKQ